jgi:hypothetical protein
MKMYQRHVCSFYGFPFVHIPKGRAISYSSSSEEHGISAIKKFIIWFGDMNDIVFEKLTISEVDGKTISYTDQESHSTLNLHKLHKAFR